MRICTLGAILMLTSGLSAAPLSHPRLFFTPQELSALRAQRSFGAHATIWRNMAESAERCLTLTPRTEWTAPVSPDPIYLNLYDRFYAIMMDMAIVEHLAFSYAYSGDERYGKAARDWTVAACRTWSHEADGAVDGGKAYAVTRLLKGLAVAYDCAYEALSPEDRELVRGTIESIGGRYYEGYFTLPSIAGPGFHTHHAIVEWGSFGVAALAILGEHEPAQQWLDATVAKFRQHLLPMGIAADGAQVEGATFWTSTMQYRLAFMDALKRVQGDDLFTEFAGQMKGDYALAGVVGEHPGGFAQTQESVLWNPSYGQLDYVSPVLLALARHYRRPIYQRLALWDKGLGALQRTRYRTPNGISLDFAWGGYAYAWYDPTLEPGAEAGLPLSFAFPSVAQYYGRTSYEPGALAFGVNAGGLAVRAGAQTVLVEAQMPKAAAVVGFEDTGAECRVEVRGAEDSAYLAQTVTLTRPDSLTIRREVTKPTEFWCHGSPAQEGNLLTWPDGTTVGVTRGAIEAYVPEGFREELIVGMGLLKCDDPMPRSYALVRMTPVEGSVEVRVRVR